MMRMIQLLAKPSLYTLLVLQALSASAQVLTPSFLNPPPPEVYGQHDFSTNPVYTLGDTLDVKWEVMNVQGDLTTFEIKLWQQGVSKNFAEESSDSDVIYSKLNLKHPSSMRNLRKTRNIKTQTINTSS